MKNKRALTLIEILIVMVIISMIAAVGIPMFTNAIQNAEARTRELNIAGVEAAKEAWALETNKTNGTPVVWASISNYMGRSITSQTDLMVKGIPINLGPIGTPATY